MLHFIKYQGTGNDFVLIDNRNGVYDSISEKQVAFLCNRRIGIGGDGLIMLNLKDGYDFEMIYFNANGKPSTMCGNGGRCIIKFAEHLGIRKTRYHFIATDGKHFAEIDLNGNVRLKMIDVSGVEVHSNYYVLNTGSPHYVKYVSDIMNTDIKNAGKVIRNSAKYIDEGINVDFVQSLEEDAIYVRTYERGVEDETLSCGTGVTAAALIAAHNENGFNTVDVKTPGGKLVVEFEKIDDEHFENIWLSGPAELVYEGDIILPVFEAVVAQKMEKLNLQ